MGQADPYGAVAHRGSEWRPVTLHQSLQWG